LHVILEGDGSFAARQNGRNEMIKIAIFAFGKSPHQMGKIRLFSVGIQILHVTFP